jgi:hypothetical protein
LQGRSLLPYITGEAEKPLRSAAVTSPPIIRGPRGGLRPTVTSYDGWSLIVASAEAPSLEEVVYTMVVDGVQRVLRPFGVVKTELYNLREDPGQARDLAKERSDVVSRLHGEFLKLLKELGAKEELVKPFEKLKV